MKLDPGVHPNISREDYDAIDAINFSRLKVMAKSPKHYRHELLNGGGTDTNARKLGRVRHIAVFEPERFASAVAVYPERRAGKEWEAFKRKHAGREIITAKEAEEVQTIQAAVRGDPVAAKYLSGGIGEATVIWTDKETGLLCKARPDFIVNPTAALPLGAIADLKTTRTASPDGFSKECWRYNTHAQVAWYLNGYEAATGVRPPFVLIPAEVDAPHVVQCYRVPEHVVAVGTEQCRNLLDHLAYCRKESRWCGYFDGEGELELPKWAVSFSDEEGIDGLDLVINGAESAEA